MELNWSQLVAVASFPVVTLLIGAFVTDRAEWRRWRRELFMTQVTGRQAYFGDVLEATNDQHRVSGQAADAVRGLRAPIPMSRVDAAAEKWDRVLARAGVSAGTEVQHALGTFDRTRADVADAINANDDSRMTASLAALDAAYAGITASINQEQNEINDGLARMVLPASQIAWRSLIRQPLGPR